MQRNAEKFREMQINAEKWISMGKWPDFEYHVGKWLKYDRSGYNSSHPSLGSPLDLGNPWRPLTTLGDPWWHAWKCLKMAKMTIFRHVANGRQGSPRFKGDPRDGWDELKPDRSYLSHFPPWYSKSKSAPLKFPLKTTRSVKNCAWESLLGYWTVHV